MNRNQRLNLIESSGTEPASPRPDAAMKPTLAQTAIAMGLRIVGTDERAERPFELFAEDPERWDGMS